MTGGRIMISAVKSGSGKTTVSCGILKALKERGLNVSAFKCGPDYIDTMFHKRILGTPSINLDTYFQDEKLMSYLFAEHSKEADISVIEGVMGYYDGISFDNPKKSSYECACNLKCPVILVLDGKGMAYSVTGIINGMKGVRDDNHIAGVIINNVNKKIYDRMKGVIERECRVIPLGFMPNHKENEIKSRHLGLNTPGEMRDIEEKIKRLGEEAEKNIDIDTLLLIAGEAEELKYEPPAFLDALRAGNDADKAVRIAVARDEAFSFIYEDNLRLLKESGCELSFFSPIHDKCLPDDIDGVIFYGGYPELYAKELSENKEMLASVRDSLNSGLPALAECGGYMYLHEYLEDGSGGSYKLTGFLKGERTRKRDRLQHFGYAELTADTDFPLLKKGDKLRAHEFHYFDSTAENGVMTVAKASDPGNKYKGMHFIKNTFCGFPHFFYYSGPKLVTGFIELCRRERGNRGL